MIKRFILWLTAFSVLILPLTVHAADAHEHQYTDEIKEPTCYAEGYYKRICTVCGEQDGETVILPKTPHTFGAWKTDMPPRCSAAGREKRICKVCRFEEFRSTPATGKHNPVTRYNFPATDTSAGERSVFCRDCNILLEKEIFPRLAEIRLKKGRFVYDGKAHKPSVSAYDEYGKSIDKKNYTVKYEDNPTEIGRHLVRVKFKKNYRGSYTLSYKIIPKTPKAFTLKGKKKAISVKYKKCDGVQIEYAENKDFTNSQKESFKKPNSVITVSALDRNKKYYLRIREYKSVDGKKYYSKWSEAKSCRTKK